MAGSVADRVYSEGDLVGVLTTEPLGRVLDYRAPEGGCGSGDFVEVPLGPRKVIGVVVDVAGLQRFWGHMHGFHPHLMRGGQIAGQKGLPRLGIAPQRFGGDAVGDGPRHLGQV